MTWRERMTGENMPESWKRSTVVPLYKGKGNVLDCDNCRKIKLLEHGMKVVEHVFEKRMRKMVEKRRAVWSCSRQRKN